MSLFLLPLFLLSAQHDTADPGLDPAQQAELTEELHHLLSKLPEKDRLLLLEIRDREKLAAVALKMNVTLRTAQLTLERIRQKWWDRQREQSEEA